MNVIFDNTVFNISACQTIKNELAVKRLSRNWGLNNLKKTWNAIPQARLQNIAIKMIFW
jgi:hypothetical protein